MAGRTVRIGLLFSTSGSYWPLGLAMLRGCLLAIDEINADPSLDLTFEPVIRNPGGETVSYARHAGELLREERLTHVVGCYTSSSRKEVLPYFEKYDGLLWYPSHYEGFETSDNVVYTGAAPNQHILPLITFLEQNYGCRGWLIGSNYIWAWENNRIMRESLTFAPNGTVLGERYVPVGDTDCNDIAGLILDSAPDFVFNTLIGDSAYAFFRAFRQAANARGLTEANRPPIASCSLAEPELIEIGSGSDDGHLSSSVYFDSIQTPANRAFLKAWQARFTNPGPASADAEASYIAVHILARAIIHAGSDNMAAVRDACGDIMFDAPQGPVRIDPENKHCYLTPRIGRSRPDGGFEIVYEAKAPVRPDPYLIWHTPRMIDRGPGSPNLRVV